MHLAVTVCRFGSFILIDVDADPGVILLSVRQRRIKNIQKGNKLLGSDKKKDNEKKSESVRNPNPLHESDFRTCSYTLPHIFFHCFIW